AAEHQAGAVGEVHGEPSVVPGGLPGAGAPRVVPQPEPGDAPGGVADGDRPGAAHELLVVALGELLARPLVALLGLTAEGARDALVGELHPGVRVGVLGEGPARV